MAATGLKLPGATKIVDGLPKSARLEKLDLSGNILISPSPEAGKVFAVKLVDLGTLTVCFHHCCQPSEHVL
jgi:hypothetical protein